jgi:hypothetical protein
MVGAFVFRVCCERCGEVRLLATSPTEACSCGRGRLAQPIVIGVCATKRVLPVVELVGLSAWTESHAEFRRARCRGPNMYGHKGGSAPAWGTARPNPASEPMPKPLKQRCPQGMRIHPKSRAFPSARVVLPTGAAELVRRRLRRDIASVSALGAEWVR